MEGNKRLLTIQEVSQKLNVHKHTLRFWEKEFSEFLQPARTNGGQRRYDHEHISLIDKIRGLVHKEGMSLATAKEELVKEGGLKRKRDAINEILGEKEEYIAVIDEVAEIIKQKIVDLYLKEKKGRKDTDI